MAESASNLLTTSALLAKRVQEMVLNGEEPPKQFVCRDHNEPTQECVNPPESQIPIIDLSLLTSSASGEQEKIELERLRLALSSWGCFQAIGHGVSSSFLNKIRQVAKDFFEQSMEEKKKISKGIEEFEGYGADPTQEGQPLDWSDRLFLNVYPQDLVKPKYWPDSPKSFREILEEYTTKTKAITEIISKAIAKSLNLEENCFVNQFGEQGTLQARFNYYSCCQVPDCVLGLKPHSDSTGYTTILQDVVEGLQILKDGHWVTVPALPNAILVLMGDQMEIMTNGVFKSPVHRVLTNSERERISVVMFYTPDPNKEIGPERGLINDETPKLFKQVKDYGSVYWEYYAKGSRAIHTAQI